MSNDNSTAQVIQVLYGVYIIYCIYSVFQNLRFLDQFKKRHGFENNRKKWKKAAKAFKTSARKLKKMTKEEIKNLYRKMAKKVHPDVGGNADKFRDLNDAYQFAYAAA